MPSSSFLLRQPKTEKPTPITLRFRYGSKSPFKFPTGETILPKYWNEKQQQAREISEFPQYPEFNARLQKIKTAVYNAYRFLDNEHLPINNQTLLEETRKRLNPTSKRTVPVTAFIEDHIQQCFAGKILNKKGKKIGIGTAKQYGNLNTNLKAYESAKNRQLLFDNINLKFKDDFVLFLQEKELAQSTIAGYIKRLKHLTKVAFKKELHQNKIFDNEDFSTPGEDVDKIYLNYTELEQIYHLDLSSHPTLELVRDTFIIASYTGLRHSDWHKFNQKHIDQKESKIRITTQKGDIQVVIPMNEIVKTLLAKYDWNIPACSQQKINKLIKKVCLMARLHSPFTYTRTEGGEVKTFTQKKWQLVCTHTARRSFATNMYKDGVPMKLIMQITGHKSEKTFLHYVKVGMEEGADYILRKQEEKREENYAAQVQKVLGIRVYLLSSPTGRFRELGIVSLDNVKQDSMEMKLNRLVEKCKTEFSNVEGVIVEGLDFYSCSVICFSGQLSFKAA
ncbi:site-specific integrase [bacterium SCSIO 12741]|nr:site-specific integrase [bacterium SCSIO 12741]